MKIPFWKVAPHADTILMSIGFEQDHGAAYREEKDYLSEVRVGGTRKWMSEDMALNLLRVLSRSISKVSGYDYQLGNRDRDEAMRAQTLLPLNAAYNMLAQRS